MNICRHLCRASANRKVRGIVHEAGSGAEKRIHSGGIVSHARSIQER